MPENNNLNPLELARKNNCSTFLFFVLSKITLGFFTASKLEKMTNIINESSKEDFIKINKNICLTFQVFHLISFLFFLVFMFVFIFFISQVNSSYHYPYYGNVIYHEYMPSILILYIFIVVIPLFIMKIISLIWSFNAKKCLDFYCLKEIKFPYKLNSFNIILFDILYINYFMNNIGLKYERFKLIYDRD